MTEVSTRIVIRLVIALGMLVFFVTVSVPTASAGPTDYCYTNAQGQHVCCTVPTCNQARAKGR